jgi:hypothetical protein
LGSADAAAGGSGGPPLVAPHPAPRPHTVSSVPAAQVRGAARVVGHNVWI